MNQEYRIDALMTPCPHTIDAVTLIDEAVQKMSIYKVRHLPVVSEGVLQGVLCHSDIKVLSSISSELRDNLKAGDLCDRDPYVVTADTPLAEVAYQMSQGRKEYALVTTPKGDFLGIFTTTDACRAIHMILGK